jgi:hypothetical protein
MDNQKRRRLTLAMRRREQILRAMKKMARTSQAGSKMPRYQTRNSMLCYSVVYLPIQLSNWRERVDAGTDAGAVDYVDRGVAEQYRVSLLGYELSELKNDLPVLGAAVQRRNWSA